MYSIMSSANNDSLTSFLIWILFTSFSSLIAVGKTPQTMLNISAESGHSCLIPDLQRECFQLFITEYEATYRFVMYGLYYVEV